MARPASAIRPPQRPSPRGRHPELGQSLEQRPATLHLDQVSRTDPRLPRPTSTTNDWRRTLVCDALADNAQLSTAYRLLLQDQCPSWLYSVRMGATTIWERWDSMLPDGSINPGEMTSFNHYALGAVADWLHRTA